MQRSTTYARIRRTWILLALSGLVASACGSALTTEEIAAANTRVVEVSEVAGAGGLAAGDTPAAGPHADTPSPVEDSAGMTESPVTAPEAAAGSATPGSSAAGADRPAVAGQPPPTDPPPNEASEPTAPTQPATGEPIKLGNVGTYSGVVGAVFQGAREALFAWAAHVNANGGIHGRPIELTAADDGNDPARNAALVKDMWENQGVVAFVGTMAALTDYASREYVDQNQIPMVGGSLIDGLWNESPNYFPQGATLEAVAAQLVKIAIDEGRSRIGVITCAEAQLCSLGLGFVEDWAPRLGIEVVYTAKTTLTAPDYTSECLGAQDRDVDFLIIGADTNTVRRIASSCARQDYRPQISLVSVAFSPELAGDPNLDQSVTALPTMPYVLDSPAFDEFRTALATYAPGTSPGADSALAWTAGKLFEAAASNVDGELTTESLRQGLWQIESDDLGGLTLPITFNEGEPTHLGFCSYPVKMDGGQVTAPFASEARCLE